MCAAHSMAAVDAELEASEPAADVLDEPAPELVLEDADGAPVRLGDFRGKVIILAFTEDGGRDACSPDGPVTKARELVAQAEGLGDQIQFIELVMRGPERVAKRAGGDDQCERGESQRGNSLMLHDRRGRQEAGQDPVGAYGLESPAGGVVVIDPAGRLRARFHGLFAPVRLMLYAAALAHGEHEAARDPQLSREPDQGSLQWILAALFALAAVLGYGLVGLWRRRPGSVRVAGKQDGP